MDATVSEPRSGLLTINTGSSSIKFALYAVPDLTPLLSGLIDGIGGHHAGFRVKSPTPSLNQHLTWGDADAPADHDAALAFLLDWFREQMAGLEIVAVGHRVVHGGTDFSAPIVIDDAAIEQLESLHALAPLHEPHNLAGIRAARHAFGSVPQIACFDTAFHRDRLFIEDAYALPRWLYDEGVRRYGFHGLSYEYIAARLAELYPDRADDRVVIAHLGNGASLCALHRDRSVASTMGFSPLDGLAMGTRCGQIDPGVLLYLMQYKGMSAQQISDLLYKESGLKGLSGGLSNDMRTLEASDDPTAAEAIDYFVHRILCEIGSLVAAMRGIDMLVFTGGIGENSVTIRARVMEGLSWLGVRLDPDRNRAGEAVLSTDDSMVLCLRLCTNEEIVIAGHALALASPLTA